MKKKLLSSILALIMCLSIISGATFALFTSESKTNVAITSGKVDVVATIGDLTLTSNVDGVVSNGWLSGKATKVDNTITLNKMMPGDKVSFDITVENKSNVTVQVRNVYNASGDLLGGLTITGYGDAQSFGFSSWKTLEVGSEAITYNVSIMLNEESGNEYQETSADISFNVEAVQGNAIVGNPYEFDEATHTYTINDESGMMLLSSIVNKCNPLPGDQHWNIKITKDMDMSGYTWMPLNTQKISFVTFDGQNHTISNLNCSMDKFGRSGFIGYWGAVYMKDITFKNVTASGTQAGILGGNVNIRYNENHGEPIQNIKIEGENIVNYQASPYEYQEEYEAIGAFFGFNHELTSEHAGVTIAEGASVKVNYNGMITKATSANEYSFGGTLITDKGNVTTTGEWYTGVTVTPENIDSIRAETGIRNEKGFNNSQAYYMFEGEFNGNFIIRCCQFVEGKKVKVVFDGSKATINGNLEISPNSKVADGQLGELDGTFTIKNFTINGDLHTWAFSNLIIENNTLSSATLDGSVCSTTFTNNKVSNSAENGVVVKNAGSVFIITNNVISKTYKNAIQIIGCADIDEPAGPGTYTITGNTFDNCGNDKPTRAVVKAYCEEKIAPIAWPIDYKVTPEGAAFIKMIINDNEFINETGIKVGILCRAKNKDDVEINETNYTDYLN